MAVFGIGAKYDDRDVCTDFITGNVACVGWDEDDYPTLHRVLQHIKTGDIVYIKSHPPNIGLIIKAVGIVIGQGVKDYPDLGRGIEMNWLWSGDERIGKLEDKYPVRNLTLYEEYNYDVQSRVIQLLVEVVPCRRH